MSEPTPTSVRETLLRQIHAADPTPWYPRDWAAAIGADREGLYAPLNDLRVANLVQLTDWVKGKGQGYLITPLGREVLADPVALTQLRDGKVPASAPEPDVPPPAATRFDIGEAARRAFYLPGQVRAVPMLIVVNLLAFAGSFAVAVRSGVDWMKFLGGGDALAMHKVGAVSADDVARGEWWRLVTNCFLHFGVAHLALNMFSLYVLRRVEALWGPGRFVVLYLICGVCGSCAGVYYQPGDLTTTIYLAGASGAIWGVMASAAVWLLLHRSHLPPAEVRQWARQLAFTLLLNLGVSMLPRISAAAHLGGGVAGALAAVLLQIHRYGPAARRAVAGLQLALLPTIVLLGLGIALEHDPRLEPFVVRAYRDQLEDHLGKLPGALDPLEQQADKLFVQEGAKREPAEVGKAREGLRALVKQAREAGDWVKRSSAGAPARGMKEKGQAMVDALVPYAEALDKQAGGEVVPNMNELRKSWQEARLAYTQAVAK